MLIIIIKKQKSQYLLKSTKYKKGKRKVGSWRMINLKTSVIGWKMGVNHDVLMIGGVCRCLLGDNLNYNHPTRCGIM